MSRPAVLALAFALAAGLASGLAGPALAHGAAAHHGGFVSGLLHPVMGLDHVAAMIAVGLLGAALGGVAIWVLPVVFPLSMALGAVLGVLGMPLPGVEQGIAASAIVLGAIVAVAARPPLTIVGAAVALFAIFHGHAHGTELPAAVGAAAYGAGFVLATALLHLAGVALGLLARGPAGGRALRAGGAAISALGVAFLAGLA